jgi:hypothetical protein
MAIGANHGRAHLIAADDYESMAETDYLLRSPANTARLMAGAEEVHRGRNLITKTVGDSRQEDAAPTGRIVLNARDTDLDLTIDN